MNIREIEALKRAVKEAVREVLREASNPFPLHTTGEVAAFFRVSRSTVLAWRKQGLLRGRCHLLSGRAIRWLFTTRDLTDFLEKNFPAPEDFGSPFHPRSSKAARIERLLKFKKLYSRRRQADEER